MDAIENTRMDLDLAETVNPVDVENMDADEALALLASMYVPGDVDPDTGEEVEGFVQTDEDTFAD